MADASAFASTSTGAEASSSRSSSAPKLTCLCSPTNHPGSFRCSRHRSPRGRPSPSSSSSGRASLAGAGVPGRGEGVRSGGGCGAGRAKGLSVLRAHLLRMIIPPSSGRDQRRCRDFQPRPSRLGQLVDT